MVKTFYNSERRHFVAACLTSAIGICCSRPLRAAVGLDPVSFVIVSDTHLGRNDSESAARQWRTAIDEINLLPGAFVLHLGDIVDSGREDQYAVYMESKAKLNKPVHEIPGNHDPDELFRKYVRTETDISVDYGGVRFVLFSNAHPDSHDGFITAAQVNWLSQHCDEAVAMGLKILICCHVPIHSNAHPDRGWYVKPGNGQAEFYAVQKQYSPHILACLHGHFHNGIRGWRDHEQTVEVLCPSVCYNQNRGLTSHIAEGKATGFFVDELRPGFLLAEVGNGQFTLQYKPLGQPAIAAYSATWPVDQKL